MSESEKTDLEAMKSQVDNVPADTGETLTAEDDKRLLRIIDSRLLPIMAVSYLFQFLDKAAIGYTAILGLRKDLHLTGLEYSWASGVYYVGYLVASYPVGLLMLRWKVAKTIAASVLIWGIVLTLTATCSNPGGLLANRFFLGVSEAAIAPGLTVVVSMWYKRSEQPLRHAAWFLGNTAAGIFGGLLSNAIGHIHSIAPWKAVFLVYGSLTVAWSVAIYFMLPDLPSTAWFLKEEDRAKAILRVKDNLTGIKNDQFKWSQCLEAVLDLKTWFIVGIQLAWTIPNGANSTFTSIVVQGFGFNVEQSLLLQVPVYGMQLILVIVTTGGTTIFRNTRTLWMAMNFAIAFAGTIMVRQISPADKWARYAGVVLAPSYASNFPLILSLMSSNFGGFTKKTTVNAISFVAYCAGNIIGPQLFTQSESPVYKSGFLGLICCLGIGLVLCILFRIYLAWENRRRESRMTQAQVNELNDAQQGLMLNLSDKTDKEIPQFRYVY